MSIATLTSIKLAAAALGSIAAIGAIGGAVMLTRPRQTAAPEARSEAPITVMTLAGKGEPRPGHGRTVDGPLDAAEFVTPTSLAADSAGNVYVSDKEANLIRKIDPAGNVTIYAGSGAAGLKDGPASEAQFNAPNGLAVGPEGSAFVADSLNHRVRRVTPNGQVETVAGTGPSGLGRGDFIDGPAGTARFNLPKGISVSNDGRVFVADTDNLRVRVIADGIVSTYAGSGDRGSQDGPRLEASFSNLLGLSLAIDGRVFIADQPSGTIRTIGLNGRVTTIARGLGFPASLAVASSGNLIVADTGNQRILILDAGGSVVEEIGAGQQGFLDGPATQARFFNPTRARCRLGGASRGFGQPPHPKVGGHTVKTSMSWSRFQQA